MASFVRIQQMIGKFFFIKFSQNMWKCVPKMCIRYLEGKRKKKKCQHCQNTWMDEHILCTKKKKKNPS